VNKTRKLKSVFFNNLCLTKRFLFKNMMTPDILYRSLFEQAATKLQQLVIPYHGYHVDRAYSMIPTSAFFPYLIELFGKKVSFRDVMRCIGALMRHSGWHLVWNENDENICISSLIVKKTTCPAVMKFFVESTDWEVIEEASNGEELRIRKKKRPATESAPEGVAKKVASPSSPNIEDLTEVR